MTLTINHPEANALAQELSEYMGESITDAVIIALRERLARAKAVGNPSLAEELLELGRKCAALPRLDDRTPDEILGYNEIGLPE